MPDHISALDRLQRAPSNWRAINRKCENCRFRHPMIATSVGRRYNPPESCLTSLYHVPQIGTVKPDKRPPNRREIVAARLVATASRTIMLEATQMMISTLLIASNGNSVIPAVRPRIQRMLKIF